MTINLFNGQTQNVASLSINSLPSHSIIVIHQNVNESNVSFATFDSLFVCGGGGGGEALINMGRVNVGQPDIIHKNSAQARVRIGCLVKGL